MALMVTNKIRIERRNGTNSGSLRLFLVINRHRYIADVYSFRSLSIFNFIWLFAKILCNEGFELVASDSYQMSHLRDIAKLLTEKHLILLLRLAIVRVSTTVHVSAAIFIRETQNNFPVCDAGCAAVPTDLVPPVSK